MLSVGCQIGGDYRCTILYLVARRCVPTVGDLRGTTIVDASMSHRWGDMPGVASLGLCGWRVSSVGDHEVHILLCAFSSHLCYIWYKGTSSMCQCSVCGSPYLYTPLLIICQICIILSLIIPNY